MLPQLRMRPLGVAVQRREAPNSRMEFIEVVRSRQVVNIVDSLEPRNFDLAELLIHLIQEGVVGGCGAGCGSRDLRSQAVAERVHPRTRFALLSPRAAAFRAVALVRCDLSLRRHGPYFSDADADADATPASWEAIALCAATRSAPALAVFSRVLRY
jgi:hypothetical protein